MSTPALATVDFGGAATAPLLIVGPSLGTSVRALWSKAATRLTGHRRVIGWDLPGHGESPSPNGPFSIADLADGVHAAVTALGAPRYHYAGVSVGGAVGLQLLLHHGHALHTAALICTGAKIRTREAWQERAEKVRGSGTAALIESALSGWFADGFARRDPRTTDALLTSLADADAQGYAATCEALAQFDVRDQLNDIAGDVLAIAGMQDTATPPATVRFLADHIPGCRYLELPDAGHLAPAEQSGQVVEALLAHTEGATDERTE